MATLREEAEFCRLALAMGLIDKGMVVAWADRAIAEIDDSPSQIIDVSLAANRPPHELLSLLRAVPGGGSMSDAAHQVLDCLRSRLVAGAVSLRSAAEMLWVYGRHAEVSENERIEAGNFPEFIYLAESGEYGTLETVRQEMFNFLEERASEDRMGLLRRRP